MDLVLVDAPIYMHDFQERLQSFAYNLELNFNNFHNCEITFIFLMSTYVTFDFMIRVIAPH
jgi:menaquinone-dependent protoporphyrinogen IX oxidase